jgi:hypothetical protein
MSTAPGRLPTLTFNMVDEAVGLLDSPSEPWSSQPQLRVDGRLDECRLRAMLGEALARYPMTRSRQLPASPRDRHYRWQITSEPNLDPLRGLECSHDHASTLARGAI